MICLDSCFIIDLLHGDQKAQKAFDKYEEEGFVLTEFVIFEVATGHFFKYGKTKSMKSFDTFIDFVQSFNILPLMNLFALDGAAHYAAQKRKGTEVSVSDCLIVSNMLAEGVHKILTKNKKHFERFNNIEVLSY